jgi:hypothetical protein
MVWVIYVLRLQQGKYYVGKSQDLKQRLEDHRLGTGSSWTSRYPLLDLMEIIPMTSEFDEDNQTIRLMGRFGIDNVRGGSFNQVQLDQHTRDVIQKMLRSADDTCFGCGKKGHFISSCPNRDRQNVEDGRDRQNVEDDRNATLTVNEEKFCDRCGRNHAIELCYAKTMNFGGPIVCMRCCRSGHIMTECYAKTTIDGKRLKHSFIEEIQQIRTEQELERIKRQKELDQHLSGDKRQLQQEELQCRITSRLQPETIEPINMTTRSQTTQSSATEKINTLKATTRSVPKRISATEEDICIIL